MTDQEKQQAVRQTLAQLLHFQSMTGHDWERCKQQDTFLLLADAILQQLSALGVAIKSDDQHSPLPDRYSGSWQRKAALAYVEDGFARTIPLMEGK